MISLARYLERMVLSWDDLPERSKYLSVLVRAYLSNAAAFKEYLQDNLLSIQKVLSLPEAEKTDIELVNELKSKMGSENILETIRLARESLRKGSLVSGIGFPISNRGRKKKEFLQMTMILQKCMCSLQRR